LNNTYLKIDANLFSSTQAAVIPYLEKKNWAHKISSSCPQLNIKTLFIFESIF
jgi:hypothetical protein